MGVTLPEEALRIIESQREKVRRELALNGKETATNLEEQARLLVGDDIYQKLIKGYTEKQWGRQCIELPEFIIRRLPLRFVYDNNYFADRYQGIPIGGYNKLIEALLQNVEVKLSTDYFTDRAHWDSVAKQIVYTGSIDQYFDFEFGCLEYRTVRFETEVLNCPNVQGNAVVNYTDRAVPYTRIIEHKHFEIFGEDLYKVPISVISREYSTEWCQGMEPYYPVNDERNSMLLARYQKKAESLENVIFGGRLAEYRYYDMAPVIRSAMNYFNDKHFSNLQAETRREAIFQCVEQSAGRCSSRCFKKWICREIGRIQQSRPIHFFSHKNHWLCSASISFTQGI